MTPTRDEIEQAIYEIKDVLLVRCLDQSYYYRRIDKYTLGTALAVLTQALEPRCEYQRGTHCNLPNGAMREVNRKMMIAVAEENKQYREALEFIIKNECGWCSARHKAKTALEGKTKECPECEGSGGTFITEIFGRQARKKNIKCPQCNGTGKAKEIV